MMLINIKNKKLYFIMILMLISIFFFRIINGHYLKVTDILLYLKNYPNLTLFLFLAAYMLSVLTLMPSLPLNLLAGVVWGGIIGGLISTLGVCLGGTMSFLISRYFKSSFSTNSNQIIKKIEEKLNSHPLLVLGLLRFNPIIPTGPLNYLLGLSSISLRRFVMTTALFLAPPSIAVAYIGEVCQSISMNDVFVKNYYNYIFIFGVSIFILLSIRIFSKIYSNKIKLK